jgi:hypothetical protein
MPRTFADTLASDAGVHLSANYWGRTCTYISKASGPREITCVVDERSELVVDAQGRFTSTMLHVFCFRDATTGIDSPQIGDALKVAGMPEEHAFTYVGMADDADENAWTLIFERRAPYSRGGGR